MIVLTHVGKLEVLDFSHTFFLISALRKIMVTTGTPWPSSTKTEILDLENENLSSSNLSPFPLDVWGAVGSQVVYMCSSLLHLAPGSRDSFQAEKRITFM